jgi:hypothetical protein
MSFRMTVIPDDQYALILKIMSQISAPQSLANQYDLHCLTARQYNGLQQLVKAGNKIYAYRLRTIRSVRPVSICSVRFVNPAANQIADIEFASAI